MEGHGRGTRGCLPRPPPKKKEKKGKVLNSCLSSFLKADTLAEFQTHIFTPVGGSDDNCASPPCAITANSIILCT
jgi:hypothetical protein